jgi:hypothetical protein
VALKDTIARINDMQREGVIGSYAIGGAVGATFYTEPATTFDLDIFLVPPSSTAGLLSLSAIYEYAAKRHWNSEGEHIVIADWPVQFLPAADPLEREALAQAIPTRIEDVETRVIRPEHLICFALRTGRSKDRIRIVQLIENKAADQSRLEDVLRRHNLTSKWDNFKQRFLND